MPGQTCEECVGAVDCTEPSMEGRAIARPNEMPRVARAPHARVLQWRAGQLPGQTCAGVRERSRGWAAFNGGPGNCPAKPSNATRPDSQKASFNGGPGNCPAKPDERERYGAAKQAPSMEGRAIARPNERVRTEPVCLTLDLQWRAGQLPGQTGRAPDDAPRRPHQPSMEGRAIARPNSPTPKRRTRPMQPLQWRAGQLPGQTCPRWGASPPASGLQWRAGQLPGQTAPKLRAVVTDIIPSMEGRAIARPNVPIVGAGPYSFGQPSMEGRAIARPNRCESPTHPRSDQTFNGGPGNCPAKLFVGQVVRVFLVIPSMEGRAIARPNLPAGSMLVAGCPPLQWRAGQLPGQTALGRDRWRPLMPLQWRAGQLPGQTLVAGRMAGCSHRLQWRAGQLPGQTHCRRRRTRGTTRPFNGGPGNCPAKRADLGDGRGPHR